MLISAFDDYLLPINLENLSILVLTIIFVPMIGMVVSVWNWRRTCIVQAILNSHVQLVVCISVWFGREFHISNVFGPTLVNNDDICVMLLSYCYSVLFVVGMYQRSTGRCSVSMSVQLMVISYLTFSSSIATLLYTW